MYLCSIVCAYALPIDSQEGCSDSATCCDGSPSNHPVEMREGLKVPVKMLKGLTAGREV